MSEVVLKDHSIHEPSTAHIHPLETIPQGTQADGVLNGHDHHDVDTGILGKCFLGLVALIAFSFGSMWIMTNSMLGALSVNDSVPSSSYVERPALQSAWPAKPIDTPLDSPREMPVLQADPEMPNVELREEDEAQLENYNWAKDDKGRTVGVTLPVDRAIDLTIERGLPSDNRAKAVVDKPTGEPAEMGAISSSHRYMRDQERKAGKKTQPSIKNGKQEMRSREIQPQSSATGSAANNSTLNKVDSDGRNLGMRRSPF